MLHEYWIFSNVLHFLPDLSIDKEFKWMEVTELVEKASKKKSVFYDWTEEKKSHENSLLKYSQKLMLQSQPWKIVTFS